MLASTCKACSWGKEQEIISSDSSISFEQCTMFSIRKRELPHMHRMQLLSRRLLNWFITFRTWRSASESPPNLRRQPRTHARLRSASESPPNLRRQPRTHARLRSASESPPALDWQYRPDAAAAVRDYVYEHEDYPYPTREEIENLKSLNVEGCSQLQVKVGNEAQQFSFRIITAVVL